MSRLGYIYLASIPYDTGRFHRTDIHNLRTPFVLARSFSLNKQRVLAKIAFKYFFFLGKRPKTVTSVLRRRPVKL